jgi:hypothetical protein
MKRNPVSNLGVEASNRPYVVPFPLKAFIHPLNPWLCVPDITL